MIEVFIIFIILLALLGGIISFLSPCNVATLPSFISYVGSQVKTTRKSIQMSLAFSLGFCLMFSVIATIFIIISGFIRFTLWFKIFSGLTVICLAFYIFLKEYWYSNVTEINKDIFNKNDNAEQIDDSELETAVMKYTGYSGAFLLGFSMGFSWITCVTPIFLAIVIIVSSLGNFFFGLVFFFFFALGIMIPYLIIGASIGKLKERFLVKLINFGSKLQKIFAIFLFYIGIELVLSAFGISGLIPLI